MERIEQVTYEPPSVPPLSAYRIPVMERVLALLMALAILVLIFAVSVMLDTRATLDRSIRTSLDNRVVSCQYVKLELPAEEFSQFRPCQMPGVVEQLR